MFIVFSPMVIFQAIHCFPRSHLSIANFLVLLSQSRGTLEITDLLLKHGGKTGAELKAEGK